MEDKDIIIKDKYTKVCLCKSISRWTIKEVIRSGAKNLEEVKRKTRATTGSCKGDRCRGKIKELLKGYGDSWN